MFYYKWLGAINMKTVVEAYTPKIDKEFPKKKNIQDLDKKLEKLLLTGENKNIAKKEK